MGSPCSDYALRFSLLKVLTDLEEVLSQLEDIVGHHQLLLLVRLLLHLKVQVDLLRDQYRKVTVLLVDLEAKGHEPHQVHPQCHAPNQQLPVTQKVQVSVCVLQEL